MSNKEKESLEKARKQLVAKRNDLVQNARQPLTKIQNEVIQYMVSKVKPTDQPGTKYTFKCSEFYALMGYVTTSYTDIKALLSEIKKVNWWVDAEVEGEDDKNLSWFNIVHANSKKETVTISFHEDIEPYIFQLVESKKYFSSYPFQYISLMKSFYSQKLYEQLNTHKHDKPKSGKHYSEWVYEIGTGSKHDLFIRIAQAAPELDQRVRWDRKEKKTKVISKYDGFAPGEPMIPESWKNFAIFKRDVLEPAIKEINKYTDMMVIYEPLKTDLAGNKYRRYTSIRFLWILKSEGQLEDTDKLIDDEYQKIEEARANHQYTLEELYGSEMKSNLEHQMNMLQREQEQYEADRKKQKANDVEYRETGELDKRADDSQYPAAVSEFGRDFSDDQLKFLFQAAFSSLPLGMIKITDFNSRDLWLCDYIGHYKQTVDATSADTRTKPYNRLLDMLKKDYDSVGFMYAERYKNNMMDRTYNQTQYLPVNNKVTTIVSESKVEYGSEKKSKMSSSVTLTTSSQEIDVQELQDPMGRVNEYLKRFDNLKQ